jgi:translation initiation factor IF-2
MNIEFPALHSDALVYFLFHSGAFVLVLAAVFLSLGLALGLAFWGRYKKRARELATETEVQKAEIADLKRKLAEQALRPLPAVEPSPAPAPAPAPAPVPVAAPQPPPPPAPAPPPPGRILEDVPAMPEFLASDPLIEEPFIEPPRRPAPLPPRPRPAAAPVPARAARAETAAIAPFSFLLDEPDQEPPDADR